MALAYWRGVKISIALPPISKRYSGWRRFWRSLRTCLNAAVVISVG
jgi:hypothetical protein